MWPNDEYVFFRAEWITGYRKPSLFLLANKVLENKKNLPLNDKLANDIPCTH